MPIDPSIAMGYRGLGELPNPMNQMAQIAQLQHSMGQNELAKYQLSAAQRADQTQNAISRAYQESIGPEGTLDYNKLQSRLAAGGAGSAIPELQNKRLTAERVAAQTEASKATTKKTNYELTTQQIDRARTSIAAARNPEEALVAIEKSKLAGYIDAADADLLAKKLGNSATFAEEQKNMLDSMTSVKDRLERIAPKPRVPNPAADLLIPGPNGTLVPNTALIGVKTGLAAAGRPTGTTVVMPPLEKTEQQEKGKLNVKVYGDIAGTADRARKILPALETSETILNNGFKTGFGTDVQTQAARVLSSLGVPEADKYATNSQLFLAQGRQALLQRQLEQKGAQSEGDAQRINQTFIQLGNTPEANKFLVATAKAQAKQDIERQKFYSDWWSKSKTYEGAEEAWLAGTGGKSLFDRPDMKSFAPKTPQSDIRSRADAILKGTP